MMRSVRPMSVAAIAVALWCALWLTQAVLADQGEPTAPFLAELDRHPGEGEQCIVCGQAIHGDEIVEVRYKGRSFFVAAKMLAELEGDPDSYFQKLQARSALFDERSMEGRAVTTGWLLFGAYVLVGLVFAAICGYLAIGRSLAPLPWFFAGLVGNIAALVVLLATGRGDTASSAIPAGLAKVPLTPAPVPCAACGATNHPSAAACSSCGKGLAPAFEAEAARV